MNCDHDSYISYGRRHADCDLACYDQMCALDAVNFYQWALDDAMIVGMMPWNWYGCPQCASIHDELGTEALNVTQATWRSVGANITSS